MAIAAKEAYNSWAVQYDTNKNKTRDLEAQALRTSLQTIPFENCLEIGCGTGKNTAWLITKAKAITAVDFSEEMLAKAKEKIQDDRVRFVQADIRQNWDFADKQYGLITFSLVLEHIEILDHVFKQVAAALTTNGHVYIGELHPFKQYMGTKARFETAEGQQVVECFNHHVSDFIQTAKKHGLTLIDVDEYFDDNNRNEVPRILTILLKK
jgi:ubiquinone/menaquinone biosynthesis C-methylase UbiE